MTLIVAESGPWTAAVALSRVLCEFVPTGWIRGRDRPELKRISKPVCVAVEVRLRAGGMSPCGLLVGRLSDDRVDDAKFIVGHSGALTAGEAAACPGLLGRPLVPGLPAEFAQGALNGLVRARAPLPPGIVEIIGAGYDDVDSSEFAFERAGGLLRLVLSHVVNGMSLDVDLLAKTLQRWHT